MNQLFSIFRIDAVRAQEIADMPDEPHVHDISLKDYFLFQGCRSIIDGSSYALKKVKL